MGVKRRQNWLGQQRVDTPHLKSVESAVSNDFDELISSLVIGEDKSYIIRGFVISMPGSIGSSANGLQLLVEDSAFLHGASSESGSFYQIPTGAPSEILSSTTNDRVEGTFTPSTDNYVGIEFTRGVDDSTIDQVPFWNPTTNIEITKTVPLAIILDYKIIISTSSFSANPNTLPIAIVQTDSSNNVVEITDRRNMMWRLATAGESEPDAFYEYPWTEGRTENFYKSTSSLSSPFEGGDKQIGNMKEFFDALMTEFKLLKGTPFWYSESVGGSIARLRQDTANSTVTGKGIVSHDATTPGLIRWSEDFFINFIGGRLRYKITKNDVSTDITLLDNQVAYVQLIRGINIPPNLIFSNGGNVVVSVGSVDWTANLQPGDFIKNAAEGDEKYYEILTVDNLFQVTLTEPFLEASSGLPGFDSQYAFGSYVTNATPSTDRHIFVADRGTVPFGQDYYWLFSRQDDGGSVPAVYVRPIGGGELEQGEEKEISDNTSLDVLSYVGSTSESDMDPDYVSLATGAKTGTENYNSTQGENLTVRNSLLTSMMSDKAQDKTIIFAPTLDYIDNTTSGLNQELTFVHDSGNPNLNILMTSSGNNGDIDLISTGTGGSPAVTGTNIVHFDGAATGVSQTFSQFRGQTFTTGGTVTTADRIELYLANNLAWPGDIVIKIYATSAGLPTGPALATTADIDMSSFGPLPTSLFSFNFITPVVLAATTQYAFAIENGTSPPLNGSFQINRASPGSYAGGNAIADFDAAGAGPWTSDAPADLDFSILGTSVPAVPPTGGSPLVLAANEGAYFSVDRNATFAETLATLTIAPISNIPLDENTYIFAIREDTDSVYLWDGTELIVGRNLTQGAMSEILDSNAYDETITIVSGAPVDDNEKTGPVTAGSMLSLPYDSRDGNSPQGYVNGKGLLEVKLNGQELISGVDYAEVGAVGSVTTFVQILIDLEVEDVLSLRIDTAGGYFGIGATAGETNTATNLGGENEVFKVKIGPDLQFRTIRAGANTNITQELNTITINDYGSYNVVTKALSGTLSLTENVILVDASSGDITITLPQVSVASSKLYNIKKIDSSLNNVIIDGNGAETIDGLASIQTNTQFESFTVVCDGTAWYII